jgi:chemotaxis protein methyltransferase CheR
MRRRERDVRHLIASVPPGVTPTVAPDALGPLLALLHERDGLDLTGYRRATLARRVQNRMISAGDATLAAYLDRLRSDPGETMRLLDRLTIKVSRFHRNPESLETLRRALGAELARSPRRLAVWSAGCGRGEEPHTLAIVLAELGQPAGPPAIVATDLDPGALADAAEAAYGEAALQDVPPSIRSRYFAPIAGLAVAGWRVAEAARRRVRLERHDLARADHPPEGGPFDLVACRNTLIYFDPPLQRRALALLVRALAPGGLLWLGEAEWPSGREALRLRTVDRRARLFRLAGEGEGADA